MGIRTVVAVVVLGTVEAAGGAGCHRRGVGGERLPWASTGPQEPFRDGLAEVRHWILEADWTAP